MALERLRRRSAETRFATVLTVVLMLAGSVAAFGAITMIGAAQMPGVPGVGLRTTPSAR
jgi:hypothetical protein